MGKFRRETLERDFNELKEGLPDIPLTERAWAAGLWDGEGSTSLQKSKEGVPRFPRMSVSQKYYPDAIDRFHEATAQLGTLTSRVRPDMTKYGVVYQWRCLVSARIRVIMEVILWPYLSPVKQHQYLHCIITQRQVEGGITDGTAGSTLIPADYESLAGERGLVL